MGGESFYDMEDFGRARKEWLQTFQRLPGGIPSHDTFNRLFQALDPAAFAETFAQWPPGSFVLNGSPSGEEIEAAARMGVEALTDLRQGLAGLMCGQEGEQGAADQGEVGQEVGVSAA